MSALILFPLSRAAAAEPYGAERVDKARGAARHVEVGFTVFGGGLHLLSIEARSRELADSFHIEAKIHSEGFLDNLFRFVSVNSAEGRVRQGTPQPSLFTSNTSSRWSESRYDLRYLGNGDFTVSRSGDGDEEETPESALPEGLRKEALDPLSALLLKVLRQKPEKLCADRTTLYDGRRLFELKFDRIGPVQMTPNDYSSYSGPALKCQVTMTRVRYNPKTGEIRRKPRAPAFIWLVRQERDQVTLPIRLETNSDYGLLVAYLNRYRAGDSRLSKLD